MAKKSTTKNDPWEPAQPYILQGLQNSGRVFDQTQPQLEAFAGMQRDSYGRLAPGAEAGIQLAQGRVNDTLAGKFAGMNPGQQTFLNAMANPRATNNYMGAMGSNPSTQTVGGLAGGGFVGQGEAAQFARGATMNGRATNDYMGAVQNNPALSGMQQFGNGNFVGGGAGADYFRDVVGGKFVNNNPYLQDNINAAVGDARDSVSSLFSRAGRYGSEANQATMAREAGRISSGARAADLSAERDRQGAAAGALDSLTRADRGMQLSALGQVGDMSAQANSQRLQALGMDESARAGAFGERMAAANMLQGITSSDRGQQLQALGLQDSSYGRDAGMRLNAMGMDDSARADAQKMQLGAAEAADRGFNLDQARMDNALGVGQDLMRGSQSLLDGAANLPWLGVGALNGNVRQASNGYGTTTSRTTDPAGLITGLAGAGATVASAFAKPSEPGKKNVFGLLGQTQDGLPIYDAEYKSETGLPGGRQPMVMADDVQQVRPDALGPPSPDGGRTVDYGKLFGGPQSRTTPGIGDGAGGMMAGDLSSAMPPVSESVAMQPRRPNFGQRLLAGVDRMSDPKNRLAALGAALMANSSQFEGLGKGLLSAQGMRQDQANQERTFGIQERGVAATEAFRQSQLARAGATDNRPSAIREGEYLLTATPEQRRAYFAAKGPIVTQGPLGTVATPRDTIFGGFGDFGVGIDEDDELTAYLKKYGG